MKEINELQEKISQFSEENTSQHLKSYNNSNYKYWLDFYYSK